MKRIALALAAASMFAGAGAAMADRVDVPGVGFITVNEGGDAVYADGNSDNGLGPLTGFVQVKSSGGVCADDNGSKDDGNEANGAESSSPTCAG